MESTLQYDHHSTAAILDAVSTLSKKYFEKQHDLPPGRFIPSIELENIPENGFGAQAVLKIFEEKYSHQITNSPGPRYFGFVTGGSTPAAVAGDWLVSTYDQNNCGSNDSIA